VFVLLIACINYVNLTTARSANRSKEVGIRKTLGAYRGQIVKQFLGEFILLSKIAAILSILLVLIFLPAFRSFSGKELPLNIFNNWEIIVGFIFFTIFMGFISGIYPAFFLSGFMPVRVLKEKMSSGSKSSSLRKILAVAQFTISVILIIGTGITFKQLNFMRNKELGFDKEEVVMIRAHRSDISSFYEGFKNQLLQNSQVRNVTGMDEILGANFQTATLVPEGSLGNKALVVPQLTVFHDFTETFDMEIAAGRGFSIKFPSDITEGIIINEAAAGQFGWTPEEAVGKRLKWAESIQVRVVGVVKNFNYTTLEQPITPFTLTMPRSEGHMNRVMKYIAVKVISDDIQETLAFLRSKWENAIPSRSFDYFFLDDELNTLYAAQEKMGKVFMVVSILTIFIACLGIIALASFMAAVRTKEIGIRKVLGASSASVVFLLSKEFIKWVLVANLVAWPIVYFIMYRWLQDFAYQTNITLGMFLSSAGLTLVFALMAVSYRSIKASVSDPINSLRYE
jgi:putative ABC transport system permease protein